MATPVAIVNPVADSAHGLPGVNSKPYFLARKVMRNSNMIKICIINSHTIISG